MSTKATPKSILKHKHDSINFHENLENNYDDDDDDDGDVISRSSASHQRHSSIRATFFTENESDYDDKSQLNINLKLNEATVSSEKLKYNKQNEEDYFKDEIDIHHHHQHHARSYNNNNNNNNDADLIDNLTKSDKDTKENLSNRKKRFYRLNSVLYVLHNRELTKEIIKLLLASTDGFFKRIENELKHSHPSVKNDQNMSSNSSTQKCELMNTYKDKFIPILKSFLLGEQFLNIDNNEHKILNNLNAKINNDAITLMHERNFILSEPDLPVERLLEQMKYKLFNYYIPLPAKNENKHEQINNDDISAARLVPKCKTIATLIKNNLTIENAVCGSLPNHHAIDEHMRKKNTLTCKSELSTPSSSSSSSSSSSKNNLLSSNYSFFDAYENEFEAFNDEILINLYRNKSITSPLIKNQVKLTHNTFDRSKKHTNFTTSNKETLYNEKSKAKAIIEASKKTKKIVRFADSLGLDLANVRVISNNSFADIYTIDYSKQQQQKYGSHDNHDDFLSDNQLKQIQQHLKHVEHLILIPCFDLTTLKITPQQQQQECKFIEYHFDNENKLLKCLIRVKNISFEKHVFLRVTFNSWKTYSDIEGIFTKLTTLKCSPVPLLSISCSKLSTNDIYESESSSNANTSSHQSQHNDEYSNNYDYFITTIYIPDYKLIQTEIYRELKQQIIEQTRFNDNSVFIEFAIYYKANNNIYWDNNYAQNYKFQCLYQQI